MAIDLLNSFLQKNQNVSSNSKGTESQTVQNSQSVQKLPQSLQVMRAIRALQAGQTIQGEVISVKGNDVQLSILKDVIIDAKLAQSMNLTPGVTLPFQIKANNSQGLSLIPLFTNIAADPNVMKALEMAQVPVNDRSLEMVQTLMEKGMPIDKQSVQDMYREIVGFKDSPVKDIVTLHQLEMSVSQKNLTQLSLYQNNQHYLNESFIHIGSLIGDHLEQLAVAGKTQEIINLVNDLQLLFKSNEISTSFGGQEGQNNSNLISDNSLHSSENLIETSPVENEVSGKVVSMQLTEESVLLKDGLVSIKESIIQSEDSNSKAAKGQEAKELQNTNVLSRTTSDTLDWKDLNESILLGKSKEKISGLFEKIWNREVGKQWLLEPEAVMEKKNVREFYDKLSGQMKQLERIFQETSQGKTPVAKAIQNTSSNLDFMNQLNQMHAYIQLPLKMANQNAHGELYVFTNRKNIRNQNGKITALLHLDMDNLGKMDVYVALENNKVNTNFYLEKEEHLAFLEQHMDMLTARLQKRGYQCDIKATLRNNEEEPVIKMIEKQQGTSMLLSMQAFDVRA